MQKHEQWERRWELADLKSASLGRTYLCASASVRTRLGADLSLAQINAPEDLPEGAETLIVAGGGTLIDRAKVFRKNTHPALKLVAIPSIWGSGA
ncbi:MAG TPA: hypothetical protein VF135_10470, partial [Terriglobales bacterium]